MEKKSIGIIGLNGFVGNVLKHYYPAAKGYDIKGDCDPLKDVLSCNYIFMAVNIQDNCISQESRAMLDNYFAQAKPKSVVIIKSTFVPSTCDYFQQLHKHLYFIYNPEFLTEMTAWEDFTKPWIQVLGVPQESLHLVHEIFDLLPQAPVKRVISPKDAEMLKHSFNSFYATKVVFFNQIYDACQQLGVDYETIREIMVQEPRVGNSHSIIFHKGYRGAGGKCLPKELENIQKVATIPLLEKVKEINNELLRIK